MRILFASSSSGSRGGGEIHLLYLAEALAALGHEVLLWVSDHPRMDELASKFGAFGRVVRAPYVNTYDRWLRSLDTGMRAAGAIAATWTNLAPDVIHVNKQNLEDGLDLIEAARLTGIPALTVIHITQSARFLGARFAGIRDRQAKRVLNRFEGPLVVVQPARARDLMDFLGDGSRIHTINNGVPLYELESLRRLRTKTRQALRVGDGEKLVLAVGRLVDQKRPDLFLEVAEHVTSVHEDVHFLWVGDGERADVWESRVKGMTSRNRIHRVDWQASVEPFLAAGDLFLHTAAYEGLPLALIEAMSARLPCAVPEDLATDLEVLPVSDLIRFEHPGQVLAALNDDEILESKATAGRRFVEAYLSIDAMARQYLDLYESLLEDRVIA